MCQPALTLPPLPHCTPAAIAPKLHHHLQLLSNVAPGLVTGCYLTGSLALGAFDERRSDVDFVAVLAQPAAAGDLAALRHVHEEIERVERRWKLEGSYLQWHDLGRLPPQVAPGPHCAGGVFHPSGYHDLNPVTWWLLKQGGIPLLGPLPQELPFTVEWATVVDYMRANLRTYWRQFTHPSPRLSSLLAGEGVEWAVLGICRLWHALHTGAISSKVQAGEAMLSVCPVRWRPIVAEGLALRRGEASNYRWRVQRAGEAMRFVRYAIAECSAMYAPPVSERDA